MYTRAKQYESYEHRPPASRARPSGSRQAQQGEREARRQLAYSKGYERWCALQEKRRVRLQQKARDLIHRWEEEEQADAMHRARVAVQQAVAQLQAAAQQQAQQLAQQLAEAEVYPYP